MISLVTPGVLLSAMLMAAPAPPVQPLDKAAASLAFVPDDALFYGVSLRNREQLDALLRSKAWAKLMGLPLVDLGRAAFNLAWYRDDGPQAQFRAWYAQEENQQLVALLGEMVSDEAFGYGGRKSADFVALMTALQAANQLAPVMGLLQGQNPQQAQSPEGRARVLLQAVADNAALVTAPDLVFGFKLRDTKNARAQLARLDELMRGLAMQFPPLAGRWSTAKIAGANFHTLRLDGSQVPWDQVPWQAFEERQGQFDGLRKKLAGLKLTVSVGLRGSFLLLSIAEGTEPLARLEQPGKLLADRKELAPLRRFADRRLTGIQFLTQEWQRVHAGEGGVAEALLDYFKPGVLTEEQERRVRADAKALDKDLARYESKPGAALTFAFLTERGSESYAYDWTAGAGKPSVPPLTILEHIGGAPLAFSASRSPYDPEEYRLLVKWVRVIWGYAEEFGLPHIPEPFREQYQQTMKRVRPILARLDKATGQMLLPALADGQGAFVLDATLKRKQWHPVMPEAEKELPLLEPALVFSVSDAALLRKAGAEYRGIVNDVLELLAEAGVVSGKVPPPGEKKAEGIDATFYTYGAPPEAGIAPGLALTAGLSERWLALTLSPGHAGRLLKATPLKVDSPALASVPQPRSVGYVRWEGLVDALAPWIDYGLVHGKANEASGMDVRGQARTVLDVLKVFRSTASASYPEGGAMVRRSEIIIQDRD